jgi:hypothetical protein
MKLESSKGNSSEIFVSNGKTQVTVSTWANCEGVNVVVTRENLATQLAGPLTWDDVDAVICALTAARQV